eukprot:TRINITY_DN35840_c0_g1_i2.p2 TRINITY_DN35840_c0_g1~~TRINITY_DN35840_c0_g1_i2.p2  ORF type:complete len:345 (+),score=102.71 TRINITY_DN35840_c0_g1_i2:63-1037(+)
MGPLRAAVRTVGGECFSLDLGEGPTAADVAERLVADHGFARESLRIVHRGQVLPHAGPEAAALAPLAPGPSGADPPTVPLVVVGRRVPAAPPQPAAPAAGAAAAAAPAGEEGDAGDAALAAVLAEVTAGPTALEQGLARVPGFDALREAAAGDPAELPQLLAAVRAHEPQLLGLIDADPGAFVDILSGGLPEWGEGGAAGLSDEEGEAPEGGAPPPAPGQPAVTGELAVAAALLDLARGPTPLEAALGAVPVWEDLRGRVQRGELSRDAALATLRELSPDAAQLLEEHLAASEDPAADPIFAYPLPEWDGGGDGADSQSESDSG